MARSGSSSKNKGNERLHEEANESNDSDRRIDQDVAETLLNQTRKKKKKAPAPRQDKNDSDSESHSSADELAQLRAEVAALRAERAEWTKGDKQRTHEPPGLIGSKPETITGKRIPIPEKKQKINAKEWQRMLGWTNDKAPWLRCRAYTRRAVNKAPLDLSKPWKNQEVADISQAVALLVKRVPELSRFEKNWGATQLVQETFNHMRGTFIANEISSSDDAPRKRFKKKHADPDRISDYEEYDNRSNEGNLNHDEGDDNAANEGEEIALAPEKGKGRSIDTGKNVSLKLLQTTLGHKAKSASRSSNTTQQPQDLFSPRLEPVGHSSTPPADMSVRSTTAAAALAAVNGGVPVRDKSKAYPSKTAGAKSKIALAKISSKPVSVVPSTRRTEHGSGENSNASEDDGDEDAQGTGEENAQGVSDGECNCPGDDTSKDIGGYDLDMNPPKPKSPKLPGREQLSRKSKTQAKEISSTQFPKGKKRQLEAQDEAAGKRKRGKQVDACEREYDGSSARHASNSWPEAQANAADLSDLSGSSAASQFSDGDSEAGVSNEGVDLEEDE